MKVEQSHSFPAFINNDSEILILGSFPSVVSRKLSFYYMYPQNRFWKVLSLIFDTGFETKNIEIKKQLLKKYKIAIYDVIESCHIKGSSDASISDVIPSNISKLIKGTKIQRIFLNGKKAEELFIMHNQHLESFAKALPSTSSANARYNLENLYQEWKVIKI